MGEDEDNISAEDEEALRKNAREFKKLGNKLIGDEAASEQICVHRSDNKPLSHVR